MSDSLFLAVWTVALSLCALLVPSEALQVLPGSPGLWRFGVAVMAALVLVASFRSSRPDEDYPDTPDAGPANAEQLTAHRLHRVK